MNYKSLNQQIKSIHNNLYQQVVKAVNTHLTIRNWLIGFYIVEFEQNGKDRAKYGTKLLQQLAKDLAIKGLSAPELSRCRQFYEIYPQILGSVTQEFKSLLPMSILGTVSQKFKNKLPIPIRGSATHKSKKLLPAPILGTLSQELQITSAIEVPENYYRDFISKISFSHIAELIKIKDNTKRMFYEMLVLKNSLSVRELEKQIATLAYERTGLSKKPKKAFAEIQKKINPAQVDDVVKSVYFFDFLNLPNQHLISENQLEEALINHLQKFILELGNGFCFEARQKRLLIDDEYYFVDLVFYHRVLKCHVLVELKTDKFKHEYLSQLNSYVSYYNHNEKKHDDNPAVGILLCTEKGRQMIEYAMAGMTQKLFVSKYLLELPSKEILAAFIEKEMKKNKFKN